jgi:hypothetical protein
MDIPSRILRAVITRKRIRHLLRRQGLRGWSHIVMAGLGPAIHVFAASIKERRGWPACAGHDA